MTAKSKIAKSEKKSPNSVSFGKFLHIYMKYKLYNEVSNVKSEIVEKIIKKNPLYLQWVFETTPIGE